MRAAGVGNGLADAVLPVVVQAGTVFRNHSPIGFGVHVAPFDLFHVVGKQLQAVRIHAAQVGGDERFGNELRLGVRHANCIKKLQGKLRKPAGGDENFRIRHRNPSAYDTSRSMGNKLYS